MTETMRLRVTALTDDRSDVLKNLTECVSRPSGIKETDVTDEDYATLLVCELRRCAAAESEILAVCEELARQDGSVAARALATVAGRVNGNIAADENARRLVRSKLAEIENIADDLCDSNVTMTDMLHELTTTELFLPCREKFSEFGFAGGMFRALVAAMSDKKLPPLAGRSRSLRSARAFMRYPVRNPSTTGPSICSKAPTSCRATEAIPLLPQSFTGSSRTSIRGSPTSATICALRWRCARATCPAYAHTPRTSVRGRRCRRSR